MAFKYQTRETEEFIELYFSHVFEGYKSTWHLVNLSLGTKNMLYSTEIAIYCYLNKSAKFMKFRVD
jgi:hypothetical protein